MDSAQLFSIALGLNEPWYVKSVDLAPPAPCEKSVLRIHIDFHKGARFPCPIDGFTCEGSVHDTTTKTWRHLNFFEYKTYLTARVPRIDCGDHGVHLANVPWARLGSGFTLLFEALALLMSRGQPVAQVAEILCEHDTRLWRFIRSYVDKARCDVDMSAVSSLGIDETSKKGHNYITVFADLEQKRVLDVQSGKDSTTVGKFVQTLEEHCGKPENVKVITADMSLGFRKGILENFPCVQTVIDKFHLVKHLNDAVDRVRKQEVKTNDSLRRTKYIWLKNESNLTAPQSRKLDELSKSNLKTGRAYRMRLTLQDIYESAGSREVASTQLDKLCSWMMRTRIDQMKACTKMIRSHKDEILNYWDHRLTNAMLEGLNSIIQNIKRLARGFRNDEYFTTMIYLVAGGLSFDQLMDPSKWLISEKEVAPAGAAS